MSYKIDLMINDKEQLFELDKYAKQADSAVVYREGNTVILSVITYDNGKLTEEDFIPLAVQYLEKSYAVGKFPGGFVKREAKPGDFETLTARIIDRTIRPLFPKGYGYDTMVTTTVLSTDGEADLQVAAMNATSAALYLSSLPVEKAVYGVRIARIEGEVVINPTLSKLEESDFDLYVSGTKEELLMIEFRAQGQSKIESDVMYSEAIIDSGVVGGIAKNYLSNEVSEEEFISLLETAQQAIKEATETYEEAFSKFTKEKMVPVLKKVDYEPSLEEKIRELYLQEIENSVALLARSERESILTKIADTIESDENIVGERKAIDEIVHNIKREIVRSMILEKKVRPDGRGLSDIRDISIETNILPSAHASCLFTRGQTQALVVATLGGEFDAQTYQNLTDSSDKLERFMLHYNFPGYSVGEVDRLGPPSRRELGHGNLAKRALECLIEPDYENTVRIVSEILESNGSSSMASVCGGALALKAAKVPIRKLAAGVAMGLITEGDEYAVLTDILGLEDHDGDMDFKVTGTYEGITAMQMDIKLGGVKLEVLKEALEQAKEARFYILELMSKAEESIVYSEALPQTINFKVLPDRIVDIIGKAGSTVKEIISKFDVSVDLDRKSGNVKVTGNSEQVKNAKSYIENIVKTDEQKMPFYNAGETYKGKVKRIADFGAFIELPGGHEGLMHISKVSNKRINKIDDIFSVGDEVEVKVLSQKGFKIELAIKDYES